MPSNFFHTPFFSKDGHQFPLPGGWVEFRGFLLIRNVAEVIVILPRLGHMTQRILHLELSWRVQCEEAMCHGMMVRSSLWKVPCGEAPMAPANTDCILTSHVSRQPQRGILTSSQTLLCEQL